MVGNSEIDIFGDLNIAFTRDELTTGKKTADTLKIGYDGKVKNHTTTDFDEQNIEGLNAHALDVDQSGDVHLFGQISWNRNEFVFPFTAGSTTTDTTTHYTLTTTATNSFWIMMLIRKFTLSSRSDVDTRKSENNWCSVRN